MGKIDHLVTVKALKRHRKEELTGVRPPASNRPHTNVTHSEITKHPRFDTLSIAVPASLVSNASSKELQTQLIGQVARAAAIYQVDEIIVYDDKTSTVKNEKNTDTDPCISHLAFIAKILQYCECPKYLRKHFFPVQSDLRHVGLLPPLEVPHHLREDEQSTFREALVLDPTVIQTKNSYTTSFVDCGIRGQPVQIDRRLTPGIRCTIQINPKLHEKYYSKHSTPILHQVVSPSTPRETDGTYWGYTVRIAHSIQSVWRECPFEQEEYFKIGMTLQGKAHRVDDEDFVQILQPVTPGVQSKTSPNHYLIVFGGAGGIEDTVEADESIPANRDECHTLFDVWVNICPFSGSKTVRIEEAIMIGLTRLRPILFPEANEMTQERESGKIEPRVNEGGKQKIYSDNTQNKKEMESASSESEISDESSV